jgi:hypothetical protein
MPLLSLGRRARNETGNAEPSKEKDGGSEETPPRATKQDGENSVGEYLYSGHAGDITPNDAVAFLDELGNNLAPLDAGYRSDDEDRDDESVWDNEQQSTNAPNPTGPATDSGYASAGRGPDDPKDEADQDDTRTVFTDNQEIEVPEDVKEKLATAFSTELIRRLQEVLSNCNDSLMIRNALGEFLKEFSIRSRRTASAGQQKDATTFVRHYR